MQFANLRLTSVTYKVVASAEIDRVKSCIQMFMRCQDIVRDAVHHINIWLQGPTVTVLAEVVVSKARKVVEILSTLLLKDAMKVEIDALSKDT